MLARQLDFFYYLFIYLLLRLGLTVSTFHWFKIITILNVVF